ncbi:hypothetical protein M0R19_03075 [Candidatus Pacearchaeota archaeon]|nr:hypothetical protein [Candidatus Pacearchaeota archaeon]
MENGKIIVVVKAPALSASGYGQRSRFILKMLRERSDKYETYIVNTPWGKTGWIVENDEERKWIDFRIIETIKRFSKNQRIEPSNVDISIQVSLPVEWQMLAQYNVGDTAGVETDAVDPSWLQAVNSMDLVIVTSEHSKQGFLNTAEKINFPLSTKIEVLGFPATELTSFSDKTLDLELKTDFNFLSVALMGPRKNIEMMIQNFVEEFRNDEKVGLILKTGVVTSSLMDRHFTKAKLRAFINGLGEKKCKIYLLHGRLTEEQMIYLNHHPKIKAYVTTTHGEGFGIPIMDAVVSELPVVASVWSSLTDYMYIPNEYLKEIGKKETDVPYCAPVKYELKPLTKQEAWKGVLNEGTNWCHPYANSLREQMRKVTKDYTFYKSKAKTLSEYIKVKFKKETLYNRFYNLIDAVRKNDTKDLSEEIDTGVSFE